MKNLISICMMLIVTIASQALPLGSGIATAQEESREERDHSRRLRDSARREQWGKSFNVKGYLTEQDKNKDGVLAPEEIDGRRTRDFLEKLGIPTGKASRIDDLVKSYTARKAGDTEKKRKEFQDRLGSNLDSFGAAEDLFGVSQFGVEGETEGVLTFDEMASGMKVSDFDPKVLKTADQLLETFDRDKNGFLDGDEISRFKWKSPPPESSDLNRDGRLSKLELAKRFSIHENTSNKRYSASEEERSRNDKRSKTASSDTNSPRGGPPSRNDRGDRSRDRDRGRDSRSGSRDAPRTSSSGAVAKAVSNAKSSKGYEKYVDRLFKKYDANSDGKLNKEELSASTLLKKTKDSDGDGLISKREAVALVSGSKSNSKVSAPASGSKSRATSKKAIGEGRIVPAVSAGDRPSLTDIDVNADGQIQMHEYADAWTVKKLNEFRAKDKNGDGLLSPAEWRGGGR